MDPAGAVALVVVVVAACLWLLFRRGSILDRARDGTEAMDRADVEPEGPDEPPIRRRRGASGR